MPLPSKSDGQIRATVISSDVDERPAQPPINPDTIREAVARLSESEQFKASIKLVSFLRYVTEATLSGRSDEIKETAIGVSVYGRSPSYDPKLDTVVRTEARRLRQKLDRYFQEEGEGERIQITLPKGAYLPVFVVRDVLDTSPVTDEVNNEATSVAKTDVPAAPRPVRLLISIAVGITLLATALLLFSLRRSGGTDGLTWTSNAHISPFLTLPGEAYQPDISPNGRSAAFIRDEGNGNFKVYVVQAGGTPLRVTSGEGSDTHPAWSPDGSSLAFIRNDQRGAHLMSVAFPGGDSKVLAELDSEWHRAKGPLGPRGDSGPSWATGGSALVFSNTAPRKRGIGLYLLDLAHPVPVAVTAPGPDIRDLYPAISSDGKWVAFARFVSYDSADVYVRSLIDGKEYRLTKDDSDVLGISWGASSDDLVFSSNRNGAYGLWSIARDGSRLAPIPTSGEAAVQPTLSSAGRAIVYVDASIRSQLYGVALSKIVGASKGNAVVLSPSTRRSHSAQISPNGSRMAFVSDRSGRWELWAADVDGANAMQLTHFGAAAVGSPRWNPDGKTIAFDARPRGHSCIYTVSANGDALIRLSDPAFESKQPTWSPDGMFLYFNSNRSGVMSLWKMRRDGTEASLVIPRSATDPRFTSDGSSILFTDSSFGLKSLNLRTQSVSALPGLEGVQFDRLWTYAGGRVYYINASSHQLSLLSYDLVTHTSQVVQTLEYAPLRGFPDLSVDESARQVIYAADTEHLSNLMQITSEKR